MVTRKMTDLKEFDKNRTQDKPVLDACCGGRILCLDKNDQRSIFTYIREESHDLTNGQTLVASPDVVPDFRNMVFEDNTFNIIVFDPPHSEAIGKTSWLVKKYGEHFLYWEHDLKEGFRECFRVLKPHGTLIFKWNECQIPLKSVLSLTDEKPIFGIRDTSKKKTHLIVFMKGEKI